ncbi:MAG: fibronectin type III domain-containing protein [Oscillospiraceae bacterium]|nr:fibronectin type III domain-containing protein [Oscillospiraceae bacterium]MDY2848301.1 fibronectin type III domain-containing protein [Oscillospiraceae bacterium]
MNKKKIISCVLAAMLSMGTLTALPAETADDIGIGITAEAVDYAAPKNFKGVPGNSKVTLSWDAVIGVTKYDIFYRTSDKEYYEKYRTVSGTTCVVTGLKNGTSYDFMITANGSTFASTVKNITPTKNITADGFAYEVDKDGKKCITGYYGVGGDITLPKGYYVGEKAFEGNTDITSVTAPEDYFFGISSFKGCTKLEKVVVNGSATFGAESFMHCIKLKTVQVDGIYNGIYSAAFEWCESLTDFTIKGDEYEFSIGGTAFHCCYSLKNFEIPSKCSAIYSNAFLNCFSLEKLTVPAGTEFYYDYGEHQMGYYYGAKTESDAWNGNYVYGVADGKTSVYFEELSTSGSGMELDNGLMLTMKKFTPKKLTMVVTKGSDAEAYAKKYGVAYEYASAPVEKLAAPTGLKASKKTAKSITLTWNSVKGAEGYTVYIYNTKTGKYEKYKNVKSNKCVVSGLTKNTSYKFKVAAVDKTDSGYQTGEMSKALSVKTKSK